MSNDLHLLKETIKAEALNLGFCLVGFSSPTETNIDFYQQWIDKKFHAGMSYLAKEKTIQAHQNPQNIYPQCKTIISLGALYANPALTITEEFPTTGGTIARYAIGRDYHLVLAEKIDCLMHTVNTRHQFPIQWVSAIDTKPLAERALAVQAGLGWIAKNSMLTNPQFGSALFLCEILIDIDLPADEPFDKDYCGTCTRCIDACPTQCIHPDRTIDANRCLSYLTIEHRGVINNEYFNAINPSIFGCDICLQVCPWNKKAKPMPMMKEFLAEDQLIVINITENFEKIIRSFHKHFEHSAIRRAGKQGFLRNCMIRLSQNPTNENTAMIDAIVSAMPNSYLEEQKKQIDIYLENKKGS